MYKYLSDISSKRHLFLTLLLRITAPALCSLCCLVFTGHSFENGGELFVTEGGCLYLIMLNANATFLFVVLKCSVMFSVAFFWTG